MADIITAPGKFEGEPTYAPYLWDLCLDGGADEEIGRFYVIFPTDADEEKFPDLVGVHAVLLCEDDQGFVWTQTVDTDNELDAIRDDYVSRVADDSDDE